MRSILIFGLVFTLAAVPAVQAQQVATPLRAEQPAPHVVEAPVASPLVDLTPAHAAEVQPAPEALTAVAARDVSAVTILAVIGAVVVAVALIALLR